MAHSAACAAAWATVGPNAQTAGRRGDDFAPRDPEQYAQLVKQAKAATVAHLAKVREQQLEMGEKRRKEWGVRVEKAKASRAPSAAAGRSGRQYVPVRRLLQPALRLPPLLGLFVGFNHSVSRSEIA